MAFSHSLLFLSSMVSYPPQSFVPKAKCSTPVGLLPELCISGGLLQYLGVCNLLISVRTELVLLQLY